MASNRFKCGCKINPALVYCLFFPEGVGRQEERERSMIQVTAEPSPTSQLMPEVRGERIEKREKREPSGKTISKNL